MIEKKEDARFVAARKAHQRRLSGFPRKKLNRPFVLVRMVHSFPAGLRTRRLPTGNTVQAELGSHRKPGHGRWLLAAKWVLSTAKSPEDTPQKCTAGRDAVRAVS